MKALVFSPHGLGDLVMTVPGLLRLTQMGYEIDIVIKSKVEGELTQLLRNYGVRIGRVWFVEEYRNVKLTKLLFKIVQTQYDAVFPTVGVSALKYNLFASLLRSPGKVFFNYGLWKMSNRRYTPPDGMHKSDINQQIFSQINFAKYNENIAAKVIIGDANRINNKTIVLAPGSGVLERHKRWPIEYYNELTKILIREGYYVKLVGSSAEEYFLDKFDYEILNNNAFESLIGKTNIKILLDTLAQSKLLVTNCNGISHVASLTNIRILGLYGPTSHKYTGPNTNNLHAIKSDIVCSPCYRRGFIEGCKKPLCMKSIAVETVSKIAKEIIENER